MDLEREDEDEKEDLGVRDRVGLGVRWIMVRMSGEALPGVSSHASAAPNLDPAPPCIATSFDLAEVGGVGRGAVGGSGLVPRDREP